MSQEARITQLISTLYVCQLHCAHSQSHPPSRPYPKFVKTRSVANGAKMVLTIFPASSFPPPATYVIDGADAIAHGRTSKYNQENPIFAP